MSLKKIIVGSVLVNLILGCSSLRETDVGNSNQTKEVIHPKILFVNYQVFKESGGGKKIEILNAIEREGQLPLRKEGTKSAKSGDLVCLQMNKAMIPLDSFYIANPLEQNIEYIGEDGKLGWKRIHLDSAMFSIRVQLMPQAKHIIVKEEGGVSEVLSKMKL